MRHARTAAVAIACAGALAIGLWWWLHPADATSDPGAGLELGREQPRSASAATASRPAEPGRTDAEPEAQATPTATLRERSGSYVTVRVVRIVRDDTQAPVAGAEVLHQPPEFDLLRLPTKERHELAEMAKADVEEYLRRIGGTTVTGADGTCRLPARGGALAVAARAGGRFGRGWIRAEQPEAEIVVRDDHELRVAVLLPGGRGAPGIELVARRVGSSSPGDMLRLGKTDDLGRLRWAHVQERTGNATTYPVRVAVVLPEHEAESETIDLLAPPPEVVLQIGSVGTVLVRCLDETGAPLDARYLDNPRVELAVLAKEPLGRDEMLNGRDPKREAPIDEHGVARFTGIPLGRFVACFVDSDAYNVRSVRGPTAEVPDLQTTLQHDPAGAVLGARLLGWDAIPLAKSRIRVEWRSPGAVGPMGSRVWRSDEAGRIRCSLGTLPVGKSVFLAIGGLAPGPAQKHELAIELPASSLRSGTNELGDLHLAGRRVLVSGRFVFEGEVQAPLPQLCVERMVGGRWSLSDLTAENTGQGRFEVSGFAQDGEPLRLTAPSGQFLPPDPIECRAGAKDVEIRLRSAGSVTASLLVDAGVPLNSLVVRLGPASAPDRRDPMTAFGDLMAFRKPDGAIDRTWKGLAPGTYRLTVECVGCSEPLARLDGIAVASGPSTDPRLAAIDLRGRLTKLRVRVTNASGAPFADARAAVVVRSSGGDWRGFRLGRGEVDLVASAPLDLLVVAPGHRVAVLDAVREDRTLALERAPEAQVRIELPGALPEGHSLGVRLTPSLALVPQAKNILFDDAQMQSAEELLTEVVRREPDGLGRFALRFAGKHAVVAMLARAGRSREDQDVEPREVVLGSGAGSAPATITLGKRGFDEALDALAR